MAKQVIVRFQGIAFRADVWGLDWDLLYKKVSKLANALGLTKVRGKSAWISHESTDEVYFEDK